MASVRHAQRRSTAARTFETDVHDEIDRRARPTNPSEGASPSRTVDEVGRIRDGAGRTYVLLREDVPADEHRHLLEAATAAVVDGQCGPTCTYCPMQWLDDRQMNVLRRMSRRDHRRWKIDEWRGEAGEILAYLWNDPGLY